MWAEHDVEVRRRVVKRFVHPQVGPLEFECQVLHVPDAGQRLIVYCAAPGSATDQAFRALASTRTIVRDHVDEHDPGALPGPTHPNAAP